MRGRRRSIHSAGRPAPASLRPGVRRVLTRDHLNLGVAVPMTILVWSQETSKDLANKGIEDLMSIEVTSLSKKEQMMSQVVTAIFVITQEDIHRSEATNIPDTQLSWRLRERLEFIAVGQNLLRHHHLGSDDSGTSVNSSQVKRSAYAQFTWQF